MRKIILLCLVVIIGCLIVSGLANSGESNPNPVALPAVETKKDDGPILGQAELYYLRQALRCIKMTPQDLLYKKNRDPEMPYRLKCVDNMMANPIDVPFYTDSLARDISKPQNISGIVKRLAQTLDLDLSSIPPSTIPVSDVMAGLSGIQNLPPELKEMLAILLPGMSSGIGEIESALAKLPPEGQKNIMEKGDTFEVYQGYESVSKERMALAAIALLDKISLVQVKLKTFKSELGKPAKDFGLDETRVKGGILFYAKTTIGEVIIGDRGPNEYNGDFSLIIDLGGDDKYTGRAGGTDGRTQPPVAICLDLGNGNNEFIARMKENPPKHEGEDKLEPGNDRINFCQGGALAGIGILVVDGDGNNTFTAGDWSQGAAHLGVGILQRTGQGNDSYKGLDCVQGAASFGIGIIQDEQGDDRYRATFAAQGFGGPAGVGLLNDKSGNDNYYAGGRYEDYPQRPKGSFIAMSQGFGYGLRPSCSGGMGILIDNAGNDYYLLHNQFGIGGSYWYAFGMFVDDSGDDIYQTGNAGDYDGYTMGAAIHLASACMIDRSGNDKYHANKIGPAVGWDLSPAWLIDGGGTDEFVNVSDTWNRIAAGVQNGCGFLVKKSGLAKFDCLNYPSGHIERDCGSIGILLNLGGNGEYNTQYLRGPVRPPHELNKPPAVTTGMKPGAYWSGAGGTTDNTWCAGIDVAVPPDFKADENLANWPRRELTKPKKEEEPPLEGLDKITPPEHRSDRDSEPITATITAEELDKLWVACVTEQGANWDKSFVARDKFKALGPKMLYYVIPELASENYNESGWASAFIAAQGKAAVPILLEHLKLKDKGLRRSIIYILGDLADPSATEALLPFLQHPGLVDITCMSLGKLKDKRAVPALLKLADNKAFKESEGLRKLLVVALGNIADASAIPHLIKALDEEFFWVRYPAEQALIQIGIPAVPALLDVVKANRFPASAHAIEALGRIKSKDVKVYDALVQGLGNTDWAMRGFAVEALGDLGNTSAFSVFDTLKKTEKHPFVLHKIEWATGKLTNPPPAEPPK